MRQARAIAATWCVACGVQHVVGPPSCPAQVTLLVQRRADPTATNKAKHTALHIAASFGSAAAVGALLGAAADTAQMTDPRGRTPLMLAQLRGNAAVIQVPWACLHTASLTRALYAGPGGRDGRQQWAHAAFHAGRAPSLVLGAPHVRGFRAIQGASSFRGGRPSFAHSYLLALAPYLPPPPPLHAGARRPSPVRAMTHRQRTCCDFRCDSRHTSVLLLPLLL